MAHRAGGGLMWFDPRKALAATPPQKAGNDRPPDAIRAIHAIPTAPNSTNSTPPAADLRNPADPAYVDIREAALAAGRTPAACTVCGAVAWSVSPSTAGGPLVCWDCFKGIHHASAERKEPT